MESSGRPHPPDDRPLAGYAAFLLSQLGFHEVERLTERLRPLGLHPRHFGLLTHIASAAGQSQQALSDALGVHRTAMVALVDDLEARGLVERRRDPRDRRAYALHLTGDAARLLAEAQRAVDAHERELLVGLDEAERQQLIALLQRIAAAEGLPAGVHPGLRRSARPGPKAAGGA